MHGPRHESAYASRQIEIYVSREMITRLQPLVTNLQVPPAMTDRAQAVIPTKHTIIRTLTGLPPTRPARARTLRISLYQITVRAPVGSLDHTADQLRQASQTTVHRSRYQPFPPRSSFQRTFSSDIWTISDADAGFRIVVPVETIPRPNLLMALFLMRSHFTATSGLEIVPQAKNWGSYSRNGIASGDTFEKVVHILV